MAICFYEYFKCVGDKLYFSYSLNSLCPKTLTKFVLRVTTFGSIPLIGNCKAMIKAGHN